MADRPIWRGHLRLALVSCPVALYSAKSSSAALHFHFINPDTGNRVRMITQDAETGAELSRRDLVKGYEFKKNHYLIMTDEDFEAARIESSATLNIEKFVPAKDLDPVYYENSYFLAPDGDAGRDVYAVLREAIVQSGRVALSRVVMARRERAVAIVPTERGLIAHTLHEAKDLHDAQAIFEDIPTTKPDAEMVALATQLVDRQTGQFDPADMDDRYEARLRKVIDAKLKGEGIEPEPEPQEDRGNVVDLMAALKRSLQASTSSSKPAQASAPAPEVKGEKQPPKRVQSPPAAPTKAKAAAKPAKAAAPKPAAKATVRKRA